MTHPTPERLGAYLDGELEAAARAAIDAHLTECTECGALLADLAAVDDAAREMPLAVPAGYFENFAPRVRARLERRTRRWHPPVWGWAAAAALLLAVVTPLALREADAPASAPVTADAERMSKSPPRTAQSAGGDFAQDAPAARAEVPAADRPLAGAAAPAKPEAFDQARDTRRSNRSPESRVVRRDRAEQDAAGAGAPPPPALRAPQPAAPPNEEQAGRQLEARPAQDRSQLAKDDDAPRALGYVAAPPAAPATGPRQDTPRSQNTVSPAPLAAARKAAESKTAETAEDKEQAVAAIAEKPEARRAGGLQESVTATDSVDLAAGRESMKFRSLARSKPPRSDAEARALRESWRTFASEHPDQPEADEARVRMVEAGALAYRLGRRPQDRDVALRDGRDYLERPVAPQADRVRAALRALEPTGQQR